MRTRRLALSALVLVAGVLLAPAPARAENAATVRVDANAFTPFEVAVDPGGTVTWLVQEGGHTIVADDGRFRLRGSGGSTLPAGSTASVTFADDEYVAYYCEIHGGAGGQGMAGRVRVGAPAPPPPHEAPVIRVPEDRATVAEAVAVAAPGHRIELGPGDHPVTEPVVIDVDGVTISGTGGGTRLVPAAGQHGFPTTALHIRASHTRIEALEVGAFRSSGIHLDGANAAELVDVRVDGGGFTLDGIVATAVTGVTLRDTTTIGTRRAGVRVAACVACGVLIDGARSMGNDIGLLVEGARGVTVRRSVFEANGTGVIGRTARSAAPLRPLVITLVDNAIAANTRGGIRLSGAEDTTVAGNSVIGSATGIVLAGDPSRRTAIRANVVDGAITWDGLGLDITFRDNRHPGGAANDPTLDPTASLHGEDST